jgi:hypothetical protein
MATLSLQIDEWDADKRGYSRFSRIKTSMVHFERNVLYKFYSRNIMLRACAEAAEASSEASRCSGGNEMLPHSATLRAEDSVQHDNSA